MNEQIQAVQRMQDYIKRHIKDRITPADLARVSMFSPWHAARLFKEYTNYTPGDYIRRMKLSESALILKNTNRKVLDVALEFGFCSVDGYQRAFLKEFGCNPKEYARNPIPITYFIPYGVKYSEIRKEHHMKEVKNVFVQKIHKQARKVIIKRGIKATEFFSYCEEVGCEIWGLISSMQSICGEAVCLWLPRHYQTPGTSKYVQGVEVPLSYEGEIMEGFDTIVLPEADYLMFQGEPFEEEDYCQAIEEVQEAIRKYNPESFGMEWDQFNPRIQLEPIGKRGYIELLAVKEKK